MQTETASEVLAQLCLAFSILNNRSMIIDDLVVDVPIQTKSGSKWDQYTDHGGLNMRLVNRLSKYCMFPNEVSGWSRTTQNDFADFVARPLNKSAKLSSRNDWWVNAQGKNMNYVKGKYNINRNHIIVNDKLYASKSSQMNNVYKAYRQTGHSSGIDKWNPADIWVINREGFKSIISLNRVFAKRERATLTVVNQLLAKQFVDRNIIPISLKKPKSYPPHCDEINTGEFVQVVSLGDSNLPVIEYTDKEKGRVNQDVKINFTIKTVKLPVGKNGIKEAARAKRGQNVIGEVQKGSEKHIRLKYHVHDKKMELEYTQTGGDSYAAAKMGNIGRANFQRVINQTSTQGVNKLNSIQRNYSDIDVRTSPWFNASQLDITSNKTADKPRNNRVLEPHIPRLMDYVDDIWKEINGRNMTALEKRTYSDGTQWWSKARAGEIGVAIGSISNAPAKKRVIQNLYELAAAISDTVGLTKNELGSDPIGISFGTRMKTAFSSSAYVKVY